MNRREFIGGVVAAGVAGTLPVEVKPEWTLSIENRLVQFDKNAVRVVRWIGRPYEWEGGIAPTSSDLIIFHQCHSNSFIAPGSVEDV